MRMTGVALDTDLSWTAPVEYSPATYDVYFGSSEPNLLLPNFGLTQIIDNGVATTIASGELQTAYGSLADDTTYYWVVDSYNGTELHQGYSWSFTTLPASSAWKETRKVVYKPDAGKQFFTLKPNDSISLSIPKSNSETAVRRFLRVVGGVEMPPPFHGRGEDKFRDAEVLIDDCLNSEVTKNESYSLYFRGDNDKFERHAYYRIANGTLKPGKLTVTLPVLKKNDLQKSPEGDFGITIELFNKKPGRTPNDIYDEPDKILYIPVPEGSSDYQQVKKTFELPENLSCVLLIVGGTDFSGECWVESPILEQDGERACSIPFTKLADRKDKTNYWVGVNLSMRSWPMWKLKSDGKTVFEGRRFDRASYVADFFIPLPDDLIGEATFELTLLKESHRASFPYELRQVELIEETARDYEVISVPKFVRKQGPLGILIETNKPDIELSIKSDGDVKPGSREVRFEQPGLHVVEFRAGEAGVPIHFEFDDGQRVEKAEVAQVIAKPSEEIYLSSGDEMYLDKDYELYDHFFKWYVANRIGNWYQFRPSYQWSGFRIVDPSWVRNYISLLEGLEMPFAWQVEGRTLAGNRLNPSLKTLMSPMFRGKQAHENDGGYYYWRHIRYKGLSSDIAARNWPYGGIFAKHRPIYTDHGTFVHYDPEGVKDMADGALQFVDNVRYSKGESTRHTGPSTLFRYLYQAGYDWLGAEQMYGPEEVILSSLRGASRAYSRSGYGTLHAMQWGSRDFTNSKHALRFYMSLAVAYMHGSSQMNTEDALWVDEYMNDRYSKSGKAHIFAQHQMLDFIETHTRRGSLNSPIAVVQGRNDAWKCFGRHSLWSQSGQKWKFNKAAQSWDLLKVFYPENTLNMCGPDGWFTSTPYGTVDILPIEAPLDVMKEYKAMIFLGWNTFDEHEFMRIRDFVFDGGTLLLSGAHLNVELQPDAPVKFPEQDAVIRELLGENYREISEKTTREFGLGKIRPPLKNQD
ncbi:Ig-like domain-containing protein [Anaerohalosphaera lusitana]|nr:hypothetical protein [Anaerohalosphaera lusitana]